MANLYDLPKDMLVKLCSTIQEETRKEGKYYISEHKAGGYGVFISEFNSEEELKKYLISYIKKLGKLIWILIILLKQ